MSFCVIVYLRSGVVEGFNSFKGFTTHDAVVNKKVLKRNV